MLALLPKLPKIQRPKTLKINFFYACIVYVRPILEYNSVIWSPQTKGDITVLANVQRRFTKRLPGLSNLRFLSPGRRLVNRISATNCA